MPARLSALFVLCAVVALSVLFAHTPSARSATQTPTSTGARIADAARTYQSARGRAAARVDDLMLADRQTIMARCGKQISAKEARFDERAFTVVFLTIARRGWQRERSLLTSRAEQLVKTLRATDSAVGRDYATLFLDARELVRAAPSSDVCGYVERLANVGYDSAKLPEAERIDAYVARITRFERREQALMRRVAKTTRLKVPAPLDLLDLADDRVLPPNAPLTRALDND